MADVTVNITGPSTHAPSVLKPRITTPCARPSVAADVAEMFLSRGNFRQRDSQTFTEVTRCCEPQQKLHSTLTPLQSQQCVDLTSHPAPCSSSKASTYLYARKAFQDEGRISVPFQWRIS